MSIFINFIPNLMADNFLEKRMDDYRAGRLASGAKRKSTQAERSIVIFCERVEPVTSIAIALRKENWRVAFCLSDRAGGTQLAQAHGCRFYPFNPANEEHRSRVIVDVTERWGALDCIVDLCEVGEPFTSAELDDLLEKVRH